MTAMLNRIIPGDADFPSAKEVDLHKKLSEHERFAAPYAEVLAYLPDGFDVLSRKDQANVLTELEARYPANFNAIIIGAYSLYYTHPDVATVIERLTGHTARAPQPAGHSLDPFDQAMVAVPAARNDLYRPTPEADDA